AQRHRGAHRRAVCPRAHGPGDRRRAGGGAGGRRGAAGAHRRRGDGVPGRAGGAGPAARTGRAGRRVMEGERPYTLVAELTYRCPLACGYCSNPLDLGEHNDELDTATWSRVLREAAELGVMQANLTGGEPLVRDDLEALVAAARAADLYTNLITSGVPLSAARLGRLRDAGLDSVQLSVQDTDRDGAVWIAGRDCLDAKVELARAARALGLPLTLNVVLHRGNIARVADFVALGEEVGAERLELANTQYLGWALSNRDALLPSREALASARAVAEAARV